MIRKEWGSEVPSALLVSMPWTTLIEPSLGLGLLKAVLDREKIPCQVMHLNLFLLERLKPLTYFALENTYALNDFVFSGVLDPTFTHAQHRCLREKAVDLMKWKQLDPESFSDPDEIVETLLHLRDEVVPAWLEGWADEIADHKATLVGFTCMFDQTIASLAIARMVRERAPEKMLVLGGYAVRSPTAQMVLRSNPWIDAVCDGEGEITVVELVRASAGEIPIGEVPGIVFRSASGDPISTSPPPPVALDANPTPNFDDYFADIRRLSTEYMVDVMPHDLPIENSRGCWWGAKHHCVFCGIRDEDLSYRARDSAKVLETMAELQQRYGIDKFRFADYILPHQYFHTLLPALEQMGRPYKIAAEMKANITRERFSLMARAGFKEVQPGIESFSSDVLRKMHKGVSAVQNVYTLLLGRQLGVKVFYNLLYGFPDDDAAEYEGMAVQLPRLVHLDAPVGCTPVAITRHAPLQTRPETFGIERVHAEQSYDLVFSRNYLERAGFDIQDYCYYFERPFENSVRLQRLYEEIEKTVEAWRVLQFEKNVWLYREDRCESDGMTIRDKRGTEEAVHHLDAACAEVLLATEQPVTIDHLRKMDLRRVAPHEVGYVVDTLDALGLVFRDENQLVSLVLPGPTADPAAVEGSQTDASIHETMASQTG